MFNINIFVTVTRFQEVTHSEIVHFHPEIIDWETPKWMGTFKSSKTQMKINSVTF